MSSARCRSSIILLVKFAMLSEGRAVVVMTAMVDLLAGSDTPVAASSSYHWEPSSEPSFFPGRQAKIVAKGQDVGFFGVVHPEVGPWE